MARPFSFSHEGISTFREEHKAAVVDLEYLIEAGTRAQISIEQDIVAIEELLGEQDVLLQQMDQNEEKLTDPDIVVTAADVEVSEECYRNVCYRLGEKAYNTIRFSNESTYNAVSAEPRRYLAMSQEGIGEFLSKLWEKIKAFFRKIGEKLGLVGKAQAAKIEAADKTAEEVVANVEALPEQVQKETIGNIFKKLDTSNPDSIPGINTLVSAYNNIIGKAFLLNKIDVVTDLINFNYTKESINKLSKTMTDITNVLKNGKFENLQGIINTIRTTVKSFKSIYPKAHEWIRLSCNDMDWRTMGHEGEDSFSSGNMNALFNSGSVVIAGFRKNGCVLVHTDNFQKYEGTFKTDNVNIDKITNILESCKTTMDDVKEVGKFIIKNAKQSCKEHPLLVEKQSASVEAMGKLKANITDKKDVQQKELADLFKFCGFLLQALYSEAAYYPDYLNLSRYCLRPLTDLAKQLDKQ